MFRKIKSAFAPPPSAPPIAGEAAIAKAYRYWRMRVMFGMLSGYAIFYFCRKNFSMANKPIAEAFGLDKTDMGMILSIATILYAFSKFFSGALADRLNASVLMGTGLMASAVMNILFGLSPTLAFSLGMGSPLILFILFWALSNLFQGTGVPPCSKMLTYWYAPTESGRAWGVWNASHQVGGAGILMLSAYLIEHYSWQSVFYVPAAIALVTGFFLLFCLRDDPATVGLPPIEEFKGEVHPDHEAPTTTPPFKEVFKEHILTNKMIWLVCVGNFFVYIVRISVLDWGPSFLQEAKGLSPQGSAIATSGFELAGLFGAFAAGYFSDRLFKGRRGPVMVIFMLLLIAAIVGLLVVPSGQQGAISAILIAVGFFVYGPQMLVAVAATDFATKEAAATAVGLTGLFGYIGATVSGVGTGIIVDRFGWDGAFWVFIGASVIGTIVFVFTWNQRSPILDHLNTP